MASLDRDLETYPNFGDWYWLATDGRIASSRVKALIAPNDGRYQNWLAAGNTPQRWPKDTEGNESQEALNEVWAGRGLITMTPQITYKADIYRRATDEEIDELEAALASVTTRERRLFEFAQYLDHSDPLFSKIRSIAVALFEEERADELLAPSEG